MCRILQPAWRDVLSFDSAGTIDLSTFSGIYKGNPGDSTYERRNLLDAREIGGRVNSELFAQENAVSTIGQVRVCSQQC